LGYILAKNERRKGFLRAKPQTFFGMLVHTGFKELLIAEWLEMPPI